MEQLKTEEGREIIRAKLMYKEQKRHKSCHFCNKLHITIGTTQKPVYPVARCSMLIDVKAEPKPI